MSTLSKDQFEQYLLQIRRFAEGPLEELQEEVERSNVFPQEFYDLCRRNDIYRFALPAQYGGWDLSELDILRVQEEFSRGPGGMRMHMHYAADLNWRILNEFGAPEIKAQYMNGFQDKSVFTCFALTEKTGGTGADIHTTAEKDENGDYILNGEKWLISHTDCCDFAYVFAVTDPDDPKDSRISGFFVPVNTPGYEVVPMPHMMGCRGVGHSGLRFTDMKLDKKYLLGTEGQGMEIAMHALAVSRVHIAVSLLGMCQRMLEISLARASERITFGKPIVSRQMIKRELAEMQTQIHGLRCMVYDFGVDFDKDHHGRFINEKAAMCKLAAIDASRAVSDCMLEIFGGDGYFEQCPYGPTERIYRDVRALWLEEGAPNIQRITIARDCIANAGYLAYPLLEAFDDAAPTPCAEKETGRTVLEHMTKDQLVELALAYSKNAMAVDGVWFQAVEQRWGMDAAMECDDAAWEQFTVTEARRIKKVLGLPDGCGLEGLARALELKFNSLSNQTEISFDGDDLVCRVIDCRVQTARKGKGMDLHPCKSTGLIEYSGFARTIDPRISCTCLSCHPDIVDESTCCAWRFSLKPQNAAR